MRHDPVQQAVIDAAVAWAVDRCEPFGERLCAAVRTMQEEREAECARGGEEMTDTIEQRKEALIAVLSGRSKATLRCWDCGAEIMGDNSDHCAERAYAADWCMRNGEPVCSACAKDDE